MHIVTAEMFSPDRKGIAYCNHRGYIPHKYLALASSAPCLSTSLCDSDIPRRLDAASSLLVAVRIENLRLDTVQPQKTCENSQFVSCC